MEEPVHVHFGLDAVFHVWTRYLASTHLFVCTVLKPMIDFPFGPGEAPEVEK